MLSPLKRRATPYKVRAATTEDTATLVSGSPEDRLSGLDVILDKVKGLTVLDVGCHDGEVAVALACAGAARIDGCDISAASIAIAERRLSELGVPHHLEVADLSRRFRLLRGFARHYDLVCYLGVHHHLLRQMPLGRQHRLTHRIAAKAARYLVARTPADEFGLLHDWLIEAGLEPIGGLRRERMNVGPLRLYERR